MLYTEFTFQFCFTIVLWCVSMVEKNGVKSVMFACRTPFLRVSSVVKVLTAYTRCSLFPTMFYLGYALGPQSLSVLVFVWCPLILQNGSYIAAT